MNNEQIWRSLWKAQTQLTGSMHPMAGTGWGVSLALQSNLLCYPNCIVEWQLPACSEAPCSKYLREHRVRAVLYHCRGPVGHSSLCLAPCSCWNHFCWIKPRTPRKHLPSHRELDPCVHCCTWWLSSTAFALHRPAVSTSSTSFFRGKLQKICTIFKIKPSLRWVVSENFVVSLNYD